jgi:hypothetical protein
MLCEKSGEYYDDERKEKEKEKEKETEEKKTEI